MLSEEDIQNISYSQTRHFCRSGKAETAFALGVRAEGEGIVGNARFGLSSREQVQPGRVGLDAV